MAGKSLNRVQLIGNLGKDPEIKYTPQGTPVAKLTIATNERFKDKAGEWQDRTEWHNVVLWQRLAEIAGEYLKKGGKVYIEGRLQTRSWDDKTSGQKKYMTEVVGSDLILLGGPEPSYRWRQFTGLVVDLAEALGVQLVVSLGALLADVPHTLPVHVSRWLRLDLPSKVAAFGIPVTTVTAAERESAVG